MYGFQVIGFALRTGTHIARVIGRNQEEPEYMWQEAGSHVVMVITGNVVIGENK